MNNNQLYKLIESLIYESLKTQKDKYGDDKINSIKDIDPTSTYKYIDAIQKFIYVDHIGKDELKKYIDIYNDKLNKNLVDNDHRDINKFKTFDEFKKYVDSIEDVKSNTSIKKQNRSIINDQYIKTIHTDHGKYAGTYDIYVPITMEQSIELQGYNTKWCTQFPNKDKNKFIEYRFIDDISLYYFINKDGYTTMITNTENTKKYDQTIMFQIQITRDNIYEIYDNADKKINETQLYELSGIKQNDYKWKPLPDGYYEINNGKIKTICNFKNGYKNGEYIEYYENGNILKKCYYKDGKLADGDYIEYYKNKKIRIKQYIKNGKIDGKYIQYNPNGNIYIEQNYKNGILDGEEYMNYKNGNIYMKYYYKNGKYDGEFIEYYKNGSIKVKQYYKNGKLDGELVHYDKNGNIWLKENYKDGKYNGEYIKYYNNGNIKVKQNYKNDQLNGECIEYNKNEKIIKKEYYKNGIKIEDK